MSWRRRTRPVSAPPSSPTSPGRPSAEAVRARRGAAAALAKTLADAPIVEALAEVFAGVQERNHIAERLRVLYEEGRGA